MAINHFSINGALLSASSRHGALIFKALSNMTFYAFCSDGCRAKSFDGFLFIPYFKPIHSPLKGFLNAPEAAKRNLVGIEVQRTDNELL